MLVYMYAVLRVPLTTEFGIDTLTLIMEELHGIRNSECKLLVLVIRL